MAINEAQQVSKSVEQAPADPVSQNKKPYTISFDPVLWEELGAAAKRKGISRSSALAVAVSQWLGIK